jgi:small basic protein
MFWTMHLRKNLPYYVSPTVFSWVLTISACYLRQVLTVYLNLARILCEMVRYLELKASIEVKTLTILSAKGLILFKTGGNASISR